MTCSTSRKLWAQANTVMPRFLEVGDVTLDLFHRDGRVADRWLNLHPREFALFWRLAESPGIPVERQTLLREVWRLRFDPETNSLAVHISRLRSKLRAFELGTLIITTEDGSYLLDPPPGPSSFRFCQAP